MGKTSKPYEDNRSALAGLLKKNTDVPVMQEVRPVESKKTEEEELARISSMWLPAALVKKLKVHAAESGKSIKQISIEAYALYFASNT